MDTFFNRSKMLVLLRDFYVLTGLRCVVFDDRGTPVLWYPEHLPQYCKLIRSDPKGEHGCFLCDRQACDTVRKDGKLLIYPCHAGLIEVITPITVEGAIVGFLLLGHIVQGADEAEEWRYAEKCSCKYNVPMEQLRAAYQELPKTPFDKLKASADILSLAAKAVYQEGIAWQNQGSLQQRLNQFLSQHLSEDISCERLCREFSVSRATLYNISRQAFGCGASQRITQMRIGKAIQLLQNTDLSNQEICSEIGINDYNYFYRVFRRETGFPPKYYREMGRKRD